MYTLLLVFHVIVCLVLVLVVLLQAGRGGGLATAFGGGGAQSIFGGRGAATFLSKATVVLGGIFFLTSISLALMSSRATSSQRSLMQEEARRAGSTAPAPTGSPSRPPAPVPGKAPGSTPSGGSAPSGTQPSGGSTPSGTQGSGGTQQQPSSPGGR
jgi:preprotein translocase subunit SecG